MAHKNKEMVESEINARNERMQKCEKELVELDDEAKSLDEEISRVSEELEGIEDDIAKRSGDEYRKIREMIDNLKIERARARSDRQPEDRKGKGEVDVRDLDRRAQEIEIRQEGAPEGAR
jgi:ElaB/YqjD/DUF883 family membrane-anchored ribosome-binding protein